MSTDHPEGLTETEQHIDNLLESAIRVKDKAKAKIKQLSPNTRHHPPSSDEDDIFSDAAFDPAQALNQSSPKQTKVTKQTIKDDLKSAAYLATHPRRLMRSKATHIAAEKLGKRNPLTLDHDQELLDAHDAFDQAVSSNASDNSDFEDVISKLDKAQSRVQEIEEQRESLQTAWILSRHVSRVKVVRPVSRPTQSHFKHGDRFEWERYVAHMAVYYSRNFTSGYIDDFKSPPFDLEDTARIVERISITSAPWQSFLVQVRHVYMWKKPKETAKWLALFCVLWYFQYILAYFYFYVIYSTLRNRFRENSVRTVRESVGRAVDREVRVQAWGELIQRHGKHDWLEPFLDEIGPIIQLQLGDLADLLEILVNFHRWERPDLTLATLFFFLSCLLIALFADMEACVKLVWLIAGGGFFMTYPISANFPKYRLLVSHFRWVWWNIPTHAELAVLSLQEKAATKEASLKEFDYKDDGREETDGRETQAGYTFRVYDTMQRRGRLVINRRSLSFLAKTGVERVWSFSDFNEIRKLDDTDVQSTSALKNLKYLHSRSAEVLQFHFLDESKLTILLHPADRDRVFSLVLAWSGLKWQCLQIERHYAPDSERSNLDRAIKRALK